MRLLVICSLAALGSFAPLVNGMDEVGQATIHEVNWTLSTHPYCQTEGRSSIFQRQGSIAKFNFMGGRYDASSNTVEVHMIDEVKGVLSVTPDNRLIFTTSNYSTPGECVRNVKVNAGSVLGVASDVPIHSFARFHLPQVDRSLSPPGTNCKHPDRNFTIVTSGKTATLDTFTAVMGLVDEGSSTITLVDEFTHVISITPRDKAKTALNITVQHATGETRCLYVGEVLEGDVLGVKPVGKVA